MELTEEGSKKLAVYSRGSGAVGSSPIAMEKESKPAPEDSPKDVDEPEDPSDDEVFILPFPWADDQSDDGGIGGLFD